MDTFIQILTLVARITWKAVIMVLWVAGRIAELALPYVNPTIHQWINRRKR